MMGSERKELKLTAHYPLEAWVENSLVKDGIFQSVFQEILVSHDVPGKRVSCQNSLGVTAFRVPHTCF